MSDNPEERNKDSRKSAKDSIEQPTPVDRQDPTGPVSVEGNTGGNAAGKGKAAGGASGL